MLDWLSFFQNKENALAAAAIPLGASFLIWSARQIANWIGKVRTAERVRRELALKVGIDVKTRLESLPDIVNPQAEAALVRKIRSIDSPTTPFRGYVTISEDKNSYDAFNGILHEFDPEVIQAFQRFIQADSLLDRQYVGLSGDAFAALSTDRKVDAVGLLFETGREVIRYAERFLFVLSLDKRLGTVSSAIHETESDVARSRDFRKVADLLQRKQDERAMRMLKDMCGRDSDAARSDRFETLEEILTRHGVGDARRVLIALRSQGVPGSDDRREGAGH